MLKNLKQFSPPEVEEKVLDFWKTNDIFQKSLTLREKGKRFIFYEGPPTANGRPGIHHVLARVFKDIILRYKTMRGYNVPRRAGWDTHGLPVEIEVEKKLGIKNKQDIERFGIDLFNQKAKEVVWQYKDEWEKITERIGFWLDLKNAYATYENYYVESLWWILAQAAKKKLLRKDYKVVPYCPRCETPLASHELGQPGVYKKVKDPSVYIKFKLRTTNVEHRTKEKSPKSEVRGSEFLLVWTTTPWTLPANVAIAVHPALTYTKYKVGREYVWSHNPPPPLPDINAEAVEKISGKKLVGLSYEPLYSSSKFEVRSSEFYKVYAADFVSEEDGTGFVHIAPAFGEDDFNLMSASGGSVSSKKSFNFPVTVDNSGKVMAGFPGAGKFVKDADKDIIANLEGRGLMYKADTIEHDYPFCWRCQTPLLYLARTSWFIEMSGLRKELLAANKKINWIPEHIKEGRFGEWIKEAKDWAISRDRFWGTPLPIWECEKCDERFVAEGLADLDASPYFKNTFILLRHTEAEHNIKDIIASGPQGRSVSLTERGKQDAGKLAEKLSSKDGKGIDIIYASPYKRTLDLAKIIAKETGAKVVVDKRIEEGNFGIFNNRPVREHKEFFGSPLEKFTKTPPGGENLSDMRKRMFDFVREVNREHHGKKILVISHGDPLWVLEGAMRNLTNEETLSMDYIRVGEVREVQLHNWPYNKEGELDLHRPFIDEVVLECKKCGEKMSRVKEVADVWFDSGSMPWASAHFPFADATVAIKSLAYPADFICEAIDQTRGWFYTLLAVSTFLGHKAPYKNVICLGLINDKFGQKMSKSKGNIVNPWDVIAKYGVDAVRWYFYTVNSPGEPKNFDEIEIKKTLNRVINILYNSYIFYETYALKNLELRTKNLELGPLDKWILARLNQTTLKATSELEKYEIGNAAKAIEELIDDLSRWYIRRSRRRLQRPEGKSDYEACSATLGFVLLEISKLIAPFAPFFGEALYQSLNLEFRILNIESKKQNSKFQIPNSVHLCDWPTAERKLIDNELLDGMTLVRDLATKALAKRAEAGIKVRQPLAELRIKNKESGIKNNKLLEILKEEINVKEIVIVSGIEEEVELDTKITPELREEGIIREFTRLVQGLRQDAGLEPKNKIELYIDAPALSNVLASHEVELKKQTGALKLHLKRTEKFDAEINTKIDGQDIWLGIRKAHLT